MFQKYLSKKKGVNQKNVEWEKELQDYNVFLMLGKQFNLLLTQGKIPIEYLDLLIFEDVFVINPDHQYS